MSECNCDMRTKLVGDGCDICNPAKGLEYAKETIDELRATVAKLTAELEGMRKKADRYEIIRRFNAPQFADVLKLNISTGKPFDEIIDDLGPFYRAAIAEKERV